VRLEGRRERTGAIEVLDDGDADLADFAGLPTVAGVDPAATRPWATWAVLTALLAVAIVNVVAAVRLHGVGGLVDGFDRPAWSWGFVPGDPWRHAGITWVTTFFLHSGWAHLVGNGYVIAILGEAFEEQVGMARLLALLVAGSVAGTLLYAAVEPYRDVPVVGASGGISSLFAFVALRHREARIRIPVWRTWGRYGWGRTIRVNLPILGAFALWAGVEAFDAATRLDHVAHSAHLGGAAFGAGWAWLSRSRAHGEAIGERFEM
jgi:membrane associated rhomboid family serine protease